MKGPPIELDVIFCHPSRVGGGAIRMFLQEVYADRHRVEYNSFPPTLRYDDISEVSFTFDLTCRYQPRPLRALTANFLVRMAHLGQVVRRPRFVTVLRDPLERICSEFLDYRDHWQRWREVAPRDLQVLSRDVAAYADAMSRNNFYVRFFAQKDGGHARGVAQQASIKQATQEASSNMTSEDDLRNALDAMTQFDLVAPTKELPSVLSFVASCVEPELRPKAKEVATRIASDMSSRTPRATDFLASLPSSTRAKLAAVNELDIALFEQAVGGQ